MRLKYILILVNTFTLKVDELIKLLKGRRYSIKENKTKQDIFEMPDLIFPIQTIDNVMILEKKLKDDEKAIIFVKSLY